MYDNMRIVIFVGVLFSAVVLIEAQLNTTEENKLNPDTGLDIVEYCTKYGYPIESHSIVTEDGYILTLHRVPHGINNTESKRPPVLLMHGLLSCSIDWLNRGPNDSLGFLLADAGYDVWLGNQRGNTWSRNHTVLDPDVNMTFWDFSFHEIGVYDLPAMIDHILDTTQQEKIFYVGHSQGTTAFFAMASTKPEYNKKIRLMSALAPVVLMSNATTIFIELGAKYYAFLELASAYFNIHEFFRHTELLCQIANSLCFIGSEYQDLCADILYFIGGNDPSELNKDEITVFVSNTPAGASVNQLFHYIQEKISGKFRQYDYGLIGNIAKYGQSTPPDYNVTNIVAPVALYYAQKDPFASNINVEQFAEMLPNLVFKKLMSVENFSHLDFIWAIDVKTLVNDDVLALMSKY